jgi:anaerobic ribonucleoside-triphosphate reductase activating protein
MLGDNNLIFYSEYIEHTKVLGRGDRFALWVSGCCFHCEGCIGGVYHRRGKTIDIYKLADIINTVDGISGITISGGEPFLQPKLLSKLLELIKFRNLDVIVYTGFQYDDLVNGSNETIKYIPQDQWKYVRAFLEQIDILIDGKYVKEYDEGFALVGSTNQKIWCLTNKYSDIELNEIYNRKKRNIEFVIKQNKTLLVGIPDKNQADIWKRMKREVLSE